MKKQSNHQKMPEKGKYNPLDKMRHSCEHVLMMAMFRLYGHKNIIMAMGPATPEGFYFDFDTPDNFRISEENFPEIEKEMAEIIKEDLPFIHEELDPGQARKIFHNNPYKLEWIDAIEKRGEKVSIYRTGDEFTDLCSGPHASSTGEIGPFKLLSVSGAYWHGDENNKMLTRINGTCFASKKELKDFLFILEEAKKRDHKILGVQLDLFVINRDIGKGLPLLTPKGTVIRNEIITFERKLEHEAGFQEVWTPHIAKNDIYKRTGHWDHYRDVMYAPFGIDNDTYVLKPMNCPHHYMIYASRPRSYRDLPVRLSEPGTCYRYEKSGELGGLTRVRALTIDDSHILMKEDQIHHEFDLCIRMVREMFTAFKLTEYWVRLSINDPSDKIKYIADSATWKKAGLLLEEIIKDNRLNYEMGAGEASFYGPKIDFMVKDCLGRPWQMSTLQLDLFMAKRLNLTFTDRDGSEKHPVILHRGLTGSLERTIGLLIEHFAGAFPLWLAPVQVKVLPIADRHHKYAISVMQILHTAGIRTEIDDRHETLPAKIRDCQTQKIPYMLVLGDQEVKSGRVTPRLRNGTVMPAEAPEKFVKEIVKEIVNKN